MELPKKIDLKIDQTYTLRLRGLGSMGYLRTYDLIQTSEVVDILQVSEEGEDLEEPKAGEEKQMIVGASKDELFKIRGLRPGHSMIQFFTAHVGGERQKEHLLEVNVTK
jgi:hypothetical protein